MTKKVSKPFISIDRRTIALLAILFFAVIAGAKTEIGDNIVATWVNATFFKGDGGNLTNVNALNLTGQINTSVLNMSGKSLHFNNTNGIASFDFIETLSYGNAPVVLNYTLNKNATLTRTVGIIVKPVFGNLTDNTVFPNAYMTKFGDVSTGEKVPNGTKGMVSSFESNIETNQSYSDQQVSESGHAFGATTKTYNGARQTILAAIIESYNISTELKGIDFTISPKVSGSELTRGINIQDGGTTKVSRGIDILAGGGNPGTSPGFDRGIYMSNSTGASFDYGVLMLANVSTAAFQYNNAGGTTAYVMIAYDRVGAANFSVSNEGAIFSKNLAGTGNDYACINPAGVIYRSDTAC